MIVRQFRILLNLITNETPIDEVKRMAPWQLSKLKRQAEFFGLEKLKSIYKSLLDIDLNSKTGKSPANLKKSIDFFLSGL
jgi:DNA polymerase III delta subunit